ncbi:MAG: alpha/beta fold hydrolase [Gammaproteobacteria bacterium]|jgi:pimeloyl-ACP methyl ester carboxylesterase|nr:alpha/beta fold hydrolase [Gammaproteobacteria bacterium]
MSDPEGRAASPEALLDGWRSRGALEPLGGLSCFVVDEGERGAGSAEPVLWLHGFPSSSLDWRGVIDRMPAGRRHLLMDFPGFGFSAKPPAADYGYSLMEQADRVLLMLLRRRIERVHLVAHDMGTSVACELVARRRMGLLPVEIASLTLTNGSVFIEQAKLTPSQKLLRSPLAGLYTRIARWPTFRWQIRKILARPVDEVELSAMWRGMQLGDGLSTLPATIRYIEERYRFYRRWIDPLRDLDLPALVLWGRQDPVAVAGIGERLGKTIPNARQVWLDD